MKKLIILFSIIAVLFCSMSVSAATTYEYVKYGGRLELVIKTTSRWNGKETKAYGLRRGGVDIIKPNDKDYYANTVVVADDVSFLVFGHQEAETVHIYNTETGKEVFTHSYKKTSSNPNEHFHGFQFRKATVNGCSGWELVETVFSGRRNVSTVLARFYYKDGAVYQQKERKVFYQEKLF